MAPDDVDFERNPQLAYARIVWRLEALDEWREQVGKRLAGCEREIGGMLRVDEIAAAVATELKHQRTLQLTWLQKSAALCVAAVAIADGIRGFFS